ncbi:hypothetical protein PMAYCL1PPCAC_21121, partial [Pristionchus mayeri]
VRNRARYCFASSLLLAEPGQSTAERRAALPHHRHRTLSRICGDLAARLVLVLVELLHLVGVAEAHSARRLDHRLGSLHEQLALEEAHVGGGSGAEGALETRATRSRTLSAPEAGHVAARGEDGAGRRIARLADATSARRHLTLLLFLGSLGGLLSSFASLFLGGLLFSLLPSLLL